MSLHIGMFEGDSNAGWRRTAEQPKEAWICSCFEPQVPETRMPPIPGLNPPNWVNCPVCFDRRPGC